MKPVTVGNVKEFIAALKAHAKSLPVFPPKKDEVPPESDALTKRRNDVKEALKEYSTYPGLIKIVSILDNYDYTTHAATKWETALVRGAVVVPVENLNSNSYKIGDPIMSVGNQANLLKMDGTAGNNLVDGAATHAERIFRSATPEEVDRFFDSLKPETVNRIVNDAIAAKILIWG